MSLFTANTLPTPPSAVAAPAVQRRWAVAFGLYTVASNATFTQAVWVVYLAAHGYSPFAIGLFETLFHVAKFVAEAPTGVFADLVGRRASLIVSCVLGAIASLFYLHPVAPLIAVDFALQGVAYAFRGGADSALLWTLAERSGAPDHAARYSRLFSRMFLVTLCAQTLGVASGGWLSGITAALPFLCSSAALTLGIVPLLLLPEVRVERQTSARPLAHFGEGLRAAWRDPVLLGLLLLSAQTAAVMTTAGYYTQLYFAQGLGFSLAAVGLIFATTIVPDALCAALAPRVMARLPMRWLLPIFVASEAQGLLAMSTEQPVLGLVGFLVLLHAGDSVLYPAINTYINARAPEAQRATVLSLDTGLFSAAMIVLFPLFGLGLTHVSYGTAYSGLLVALVGGCLAIACGVRLLRRARGVR